MKIGSRGTVLRSIETLWGAGSVTGMTDGQLLEQFLSPRDTRAESAFSALVARHGPMVWNVCRSALSESHTAEDAFQATFLILVRKARSIRRRETLAPWLYGVARRVAVRARKIAARRESRWGEIAEMKASSKPDPSRQEEVAALLEEVDRLPEKYRTVLVMCDLERHTHAEAARLLSCPTATVSIRVARARARLRDRLTRRGLALSTVATVGLGCEAAWAAPPAALAESTIKAARSLAAGKSMTAGAVPAAVSHLTEGVLTTMSTQKLAITAASLLGTGLLASTFSLFAMSGLAQKQPDAAPAEFRLSQRDEARARERAADNLKRIALAMHNFALLQPESTFPAAAISKNGKPLLSWRVALLPYLDAASGPDNRALYEKFHLDEPWNSPHNKALVDQMPAVYGPVVKRGERKGSTCYQVFVGPGAAFEGSDGISFPKDVTDGLSTTFLVVEAAKAVPWTKPEDLPFDIEQSKVNPLPKLGGQFDRGFHVAFADGSVVLIDKKIDVATLRSLITRNGGEAILLSEIPSTPPLGTLIPAEGASTTATPRPNGAPPK
jgi:RNA polymerase sigma factor (sigma-70 family)